MPKNIIPKDTRYIPFTQQKTCCALACISMVMYKRGIPLLPQELLGYHLGLIIDPANKALFWHARTGAKPSTGYGTQMTLKKFNPNVIFKKLRIPLETRITPINTFKTKTDLMNFIARSIEQDNDILVCLNHSVLCNNNKNTGHFCVVDRIFPSKNQIRLIDPSPDCPKWKIVKIDLLIKAMKLHPNDNGNVWEVTKKTIHGTI